MKSNSKGFTLIELMVVISLMCILMGALLYSTLNWQGERKLSDSARQLQSTLHLARMAAIKNNATVIVQFTVGSGANGGVMAYVDSDNSGSYNDGETVINRVEMPKNVEIDSVAMGTGGTMTGYTRIGLPVTGQVGRVELSNDKKDSFRTLHLSAAGIMRVDKRHN